MNRLLEVIFSRLKRLLFLLVLLPLIGLAVAFFLPRSFQVKATIWALQPFQIVGQTAIAGGVSSTAGPTTPAGTQVAALTELLQTKSFALAVAKKTSIQSTLHVSDPNDADDMVFQEISSHVKVTTQGDDTFIISYTSTDSYIAQQVVTSVIQNYAIQGQALIISLGQKSIASYQPQLVDAQNQVQQTTQAEANFLQSHAGATLANDPQYAQLDAQRIQAQTQLQNIQTSVDNIKSQISVASTGPDSLFKVIDAPTMPTKPVSRTLPLLIGAGVGLSVALLASLLYIIILVRRDNAIYTISDLKNISTLPVSMQLPHLEPQTVLSMIDSVHF